MTAPTNQPFGHMPLNATFGATQPFVLGSAPETPKSERMGQVSLDDHLRGLSRLSIFLNELSNRELSLTSLLRACGQWLSERDRVLGAAVVRRQAGAQGQLTIVNIGGDSNKTPDWKFLASQLLPQFEQGSGARLARVIPFRRQRFSCLATPIDVQDLAAIVTCVAEPSEPSRLEFEFACLQHIVSYLKLQLQRQQTGQLSKQLGMSAATLALAVRAARSPTIQHAAALIVRELQRHFRCEQVILGLSRSAHQCVLQAVSEVATIDRNSDTALGMKATLDECLVRDSLGAWPPLPGVTTHQLLAHKKLAGRERLVITVPLKTSGKTMGAIAIVGPRSMAATPNIHHFLAAVAEPMAETLETVRSNQKPWIARTISRLGSNKNRIKTLLATSLAAAACFSMFLPWTYTVTGKSTIEPMTRRFCVSPHDGLLENTLAEPGDLVTAGQLLARMDGREFRWELAGVAAEIARAEKKRDSLRARQQTSDALMADLELQKLQNQAELLKFKEANLEVISPIGGVVLSGSLDRRVNYPVSKGQVLYEVAPLDSLRVEIGIPAEDYNHVEVGDQVDCYFSGLGTKPIQAKITKLHPRAEVRDQHNVFVAEVHLANADRILRPGMSGLAKVKTDSHSVGWILFHRTAEYLAAALPW